jgi:hypothetical protein
MKNSVLAVLVASAVTPALATWGPETTGYLWVCIQKNGNIQSSGNICVAAQGGWYEDVSLDDPVLLEYF